MTPDDFLRAYPPEMRDLANRARDPAQCACRFSGASEKPDGRRSRSICRPDRTVMSMVVSSSPHADSVSLGFTYGVLLDDPDHVLLGEGERLKRVRYVSLRSADDIDPILQGRFARQAGELALMPRPLRAQMMAFGERYPAGLTGGRSLTNKIAWRRTV
ncbi:MAG: hypothetical protein IPO29_02980 [Anaerolineae bacterium]|nr:hypothetical protein [Anaerolineae bacterium]